MDLNPYEENVDFFTRPGHPLENTDQLDGVKVQVEEDDGEKDMDAYCSLISRQDSFARNICGELRNNFLGMNQKEYDTHAIQPENSLNPSMSHEASRGRCKEQSPFNRIGVQRLLAFLALMLLHRAYMLVSSFLRHTKC